MAINLNNLIEKYILGKLKGNKLLDFQQKLRQSPELAFEVQFNQELADAITEREVMDLRSSLLDIREPVVKNKKTPNNLFDLSQNLDPSKITKTANADVRNVENSLQFIHLENHKKSSTERIHVVDPENKDIEYLKENTMSDNDLWKEISSALGEKDIIELRNNLKQIAAIQEIELNDYEIDQFIDHDLPDEAIAEIEEMINENHQIAAQVDLHKEINEAINENDILSVRSAIKDLIEEEQMISFAEIKRIDEYLENYLNESDQNQMEEELANDLRLKAELDLNAEINESIMEEDVMNLRNSLSNITKEEKPDSKIRQFIPNTFKQSPSRLIGAAASVAAVISVGAMTLSQQKYTTQEVYEKAYKPYEATGLYRSPVSITPEIRGVDLYNDQKYQLALEQFSQVLKDNPNHPMSNFYSGLSYQQLEEFPQAISSYQKVIEDRNNLFVELAEWYKALCYLRTNESSKAYATLNEIIKNNGYYKNDAKEIIKKLE